MASAPANRNALPWQTCSVNQGLSTRSGQHYPFDREVDSVRYLLGDLWLAFDDDMTGAAAPFAFPFRVRWLAGFGVTSASNPLTEYTRVNDQDIVIVDLDDRVVFNSTQAETFLTSDWGDGLRVLQWIQNDGAVLRLTWRLGNPDWDQSFAPATYIAPTAAILDQRTCYRMPKRVKSFRVGMTTIAGAPVFAEGFNFRMTVVPQAAIDGGRRVTRLTMRASPGDGLGRLPGCDEHETAILRINGMMPSSSGDFALDAANCYRLQRPTEVVDESPRTVDFAAPSGMGTSWHPLPLPENFEDELEERLPAALQLFNDCGPCCECEDYVRTYEGLKRIDDQLLANGRRADRIVEDTRTAIARWEAQRACRAIQPLRLIAQGEPRGTFFVGGTHCNMTKGCASPLALRLTFEGFRDGVSHDFAASVFHRCRETYRAGTDTRYDEIPVVPSGTWPVYDFLFDQADPQATSRFRARFTIPDALETDSIRVTLSVHVLNSVDAETGGTYPLPDPGDVAVPSEVLTIWASNPVLYPVRAVITKSFPIGPTAGCGGC